MFLAALSKLILPIDYGWSPRVVSCMTDVLLPSPNSVCAPSDNFKIAVGITFPIFIVELL